MKFSSTAALAACVASALAEVKLTNSDYTGIGEGKPFKITWAGAEGPVKIVVATGESKDLKVVATIDSNDSGNSFVWTPEKGSLPSGTYALEISDSKTTNYSPQFQFSGTGTASTASSSASITSSASTSSSTSSSSSTITSSYSNSTTSSATKTSSSKTSSTASSTTTGSTVKPTINNNDSPRAQSSLAFVLVTVAGLMYFS